MKVEFSDNYIKSISLEGSSVVWLEPEYHLWGECQYPDGISLKVKRNISNDHMIEEYIFTAEKDIEIKKGDIGVWLPFNDSYDTAIDCQQHRCHTHIWCGGRSSWITAVSMSGEGKKLALILLEGSLCAYSVKRRETSNDRGEFLVHPSPFSLIKGEKYTLKWKVCFYDRDIRDETAKIEGFKNFYAPYFTFFSSETPIINDISYKNELGAHTVDIDGSFFRYRVVSSLENIINKRCHFIVDNQQDAEGAYTVYDNEEKCHIYTLYNHTTGRERIGMGLFIAKYLQKHQDEHIYNSLRKYTEFVLKNYFDEETGEVFNIPHDNSKRRIYNNAWYASFFMELYKLEHDKRWLKCMFMAFKDLYTHGGLTFYPLAMDAKNAILCLRDAGMSEEEAELLALYKQNAEHIMTHGTNYPQLEVKFEDNIVVPAAMLLLDMYELTGEEKYKNEAKKHIILHDAFSAPQPDCNMYEVAIHHWDDFWFGKRKVYGDTYPHYWSTAGSLLYMRAGKIYNDDSMIMKARAGMRASLACFREDGSATCAIVTPFKCNNHIGDFEDPYANDQDWALYHYMIFCDNFEA